MGEHREMGGHEAAPEADLQCHERPPCGDVPSCPLSQQRRTQSRCPAGSTGTRGCCREHPACPQSSSSLAGTSWTVVTGAWGPASPRGTPQNLLVSPPHLPAGSEERICCASTASWPRRVAGIGWGGWGGNNSIFGFLGANCGWLLLLCSSRLVGILQRCRALGGPGAAAES